jgi:hypothetical protein
VVKLLVPQINANGLAMSWTPTLDVPVLGSGTSAATCTIEEVVEDAADILPFAAFSLSEASGHIVGGGTVSKTAPFGSAPVATGDSFDRGHVLVDGATITFVKGGDVMISFVCTGVAIASSTPTGTATTTARSDVVNAAGTAYIALFELSATAGQTFILSVTATSVATSETWVGAKSYLV